MALPENAWQGALVSPASRRPVRRPPGQMGSSVPREAGGAAVPVGTCTDAPSLTALTVRVASRSFPPFFDDNPFGIYQKILAGKIDFPRHLDFNVK